MANALMSWLVPGIIGGLGLMQNSAAQSSANNAVSFEEKAAAPGLAANQQLLQNAEAYNPAVQNQAAISQAQSQTQNTLANAIKGIQAQYASQGGTPGASTASDVQAQSATNQVLGPFAQQVATMIANEPMQKASMLQTVSQSAVGEMAPTYFKNAEVQSANAPTASAGFLGQAVSNLLKQLTPGTTGSNPTSAPNPTTALGVPTDMAQWGTAPQSGQTTGQALGLQQTIQQLLGGTTGSNPLIVSP